MVTFCHFLSFFLLLLCSPSVFCVRYQVCIWRRHWCPNHRMPSFPRSPLFFVSAFFSPFPFKFSMQGQSATTEPTSTFVSNSTEDPGVPDVPTASDMRPGGSVGGASTTWRTSPLHSNCRTGPAAAADGRTVQVPEGQRGHYWSWAWEKQVSHQWGLWQIAFLSVCSARWFVGDSVVFFLGRIGMDIFRASRDRRREPNLQGELLAQ